MRFSPLKSMRALATVERQVDCYCYCCKKPQNEDDSGSDVGCDGDGSGTWPENTHNQPVVGREDE